MDVSVEVADGVFTEPAPTTPAPGNPAGEAALEEYKKVMFDPTHPMHEAFKRRDPRAEAHVSALYKTAYPGTVPREALSGPTSEREQAGLSEAEREAAEDARDLEELRADWERDGGSYDAGLNEAKEMAQVLYAADPKLYLEAARRLGDAMGLRILRLLRSRVNI